MRHFEVVVLPEITLPDPLRPARLACLDAHRHGNTQQDRALRSLDALATPWPLFVFDIFDFGRMRDTIKEYFATLGLGE
ncbi:putative cereblon [Operophtera brumata]|uniref:Putative cereblon n=1 Tax=Operophtera brumata TaxID=104452 RepID=A0A0L7KUS4_OPEBR|nr:putative cereblon [Operophtera brumata]